MNFYIITLQLIYTEKTYPALTAYLQGCTSWARPMKNMWLVKTSKSAVDLRDAVSSRINVNLGDRVVVIPISGGWASNNIDKSVTDWMKRNL